MIALLESPATLTSISATRLNTWLGCRLRYYFKYVLKLKKPKTAALYVGSSVHSVLKHWNRARWRKETLTREQLQLLFEGTWVEGQKVEPVKWQLDEELEEKKLGWSLLEAYFDNNPVR